MPLNNRQRDFAEYYLECGNAAEAARKAGYQEKYAAQNAGKLLKNTNISAYITERITELNQQKMASADEVVQFFTSVMRGEVKDQFGLDASLADRLKAAKELMKRHDSGKSYSSDTKREDDPLTKALKEEAEKMNNGDLT